MLATVVVISNNIFRKHGKRFKWGQLLKVKKIYNTTL